MGILLVGKQVHQWKFGTSWQQPSFGARPALQLLILGHSSLLTLYWIDQAWKTNNNLFLTLGSSKFYQSATFHGGTTAKLTSAAISLNLAINLSSAQFNLNPFPAFSVKALKITRALNCRCTFPYFNFFLNALAASYLSVPSLL
jgi:hypothetical protein